MSLKFGDVGNYDSDLEYDSLVISGGGAKGISAVGCLQYLEKNGLDIPKIKEFSGVSIGSLVCVLIACNFSFEEIYEKVLLSKTFFGVEMTVGYNSILENFGMANSDKIYENLDSLLKEKFGFSPTLNDIYQKYNKKVTIVCTSILKKKEKIFNYKSKIKCSDAIKMSSNLPFLFQRIPYEGDYIIDGGVLNNFPYEYISKKCNKTLGIFLKENQDTPNTIKKKENLDYLMNILTIGIDKIVREKLKSITLKNFDIVYCESSVSTFNPSLSENSISNIYHQGMMSAKKFLESEKICVNGFKNLTLKNTFLK